MTSEHCAACGKESETLKTCSGCNAVKYCNADCQKAHRVNNIKLIAKNKLHCMMSLVICIAMLKLTLVEI